MTDDEVRKEARELLRQSNEADYAELIKHFNREAGYELPPDTPVRYTTSRTCGFNGIGLQLGMLVDANKQTLAGIFEKPRRTQREGGEVHACIDVFALGKFKSELDPKNGEYLLKESTLGDRETFFKYVNALLDYTDARGYIDRDIREIG